MAKKIIKAENTQKKEEKKKAIETSLSAQERLAEILNDPDSLNRVREMAENILGNNTAAPENQSPFNNNPTSLLHVHIRYYHPSSLNH